MTLNWPVELYALLGNRWDIATLILAIMLVMCTNVRNVVA